MKFFVTTNSGGMDQLLYRLTVLSGGLSPGNGPLALASDAENRVVLSGPNPTRGEFLFPAPAKARGSASAWIFDPSGRRIAFVRAVLGTSSLRWDGKGVDGRRVAPGVYLYQAQTNVGRFGGKIVVLDR